MELDRERKSGQKEDRIGKGGWGRVGQLCVGNGEWGRWEWGIYFSLYHLKVRASERS